MVNPSQEHHSNRQDNSQDSNAETSCLIVGGGMAGLMAAVLLTSQGVSVTVLDKGRGVGGRLTTRRIRQAGYGEGVFDYGAPFFTAHDPSFQAWVADWTEQGVVKEWPGIVQGSEVQGYRGVLSQRAIALHLAQDLDLHLQTKVIGLEWGGDRWLLQAEDKDGSPQHFQAHQLLLTCPVPQSLDLLQQSAIPVPDPIHQRLEQIHYHRCIAVLALLEQPSQIPPPGALRQPHPVLDWLICNQQTGISASPAVTLQATAEFSEAHWDLDNSRIIEELLEKAAPWLGSKVIESQIHRWRYSQPTAFYGESYCALPTPGHLVLAGDAFSSNPTQGMASNLERAALSGMAAARYFMKGSDRPAR
ncbi:MAG: FAD-dependent oxidoreductase [Oculatellaceae cyanobacterium Prado106]|jgi:hypothetical protein|nr:FAD-dependent oxidoreductase [Oculatellaceae cyanobacterium Prado106]